MDAYVKTVLTVIAACLLLQVGQGFGLAGAPKPGQADSSGVERFVVQPLPMARLLLRIDRVTGETWTMPLLRDKARVWTPVAQAPSTEPMTREEDEGAPTPPGGADQ